MAKKKKEEVIEEVTQTEIPVKEEPKIDDKVEKIKVKKKPSMKKFSNDPDGITKVDLSKPPKTEEDADQKQETADVATDQPTETLQEVVEEVSPEQTPVQNEEQPVLEEVTEEEKQEVEEVAAEAGEAIRESMNTGEPLPEGVQKLMDFMEDTGGDLNDYVKLNQDYSEMDNQSLLQEYYKQTKPHLNNEEIEFLMEDQFSFDEDVDEDRDIRRKKLALKEQVANAKTHLEENKSKYYSEIKSGSKLTGEQQEAINFYQKSQEQRKHQEKTSNNFLNRTNKFFGDKFKGFEYNVGDKKYRFNVSDTNKVKESQSSINNFIGKFLDKNNQMVDEAGYHKSLFTAMNSDAVAKHFYEQGKADALKESVAKSKNINMDPRQELNNNIDTGGLKFKVLGDTTADFKFKIKNKK